MFLFCPNPNPQAASLTFGRLEQPAVICDGAYLDFHGLGLDDVDLVAVAAPHLVVHHSHAADGVVGAAQVQQVVIGQVPLPIYSQGTHADKRA